MSGGSGVGKVMQPFSKFVVEEEGIDKVVPFGADEVIVCLHENETISFFGKVQLRVYRGTATVYGHTFHESTNYTPLYAPYSSFCHTIYVTGSTKKVGKDEIGTVIEERMDTGTSKRAILVLKPLESDIASGWFDMPRNFESTFKSSDPFQIPGFHPLMEVPHDIVVPQFVPPKEQKHIMSLFPASETLSSSKSLFSVLVCGPQHSGKSSFCRFLVNQLLNVYKEVLFLESDVGQSEFTAPGLVSLMKTPLIGPPFTHVQQPERSYYIGDTSPARNPTYYVDGFRALIDFYRSNYAGIPLVINTSGWVIGMGRDMLVEQMKYAEPDLIVNMRTPTELGRRYRGKELNDVFFLNNAFLSQNFSAKQPQVVDTHITVHTGQNVLRKDKMPPDVRMVQLLSYFQAHSVPVSSHIPYCVPWNKLRLVVMEGSVPPSQMLYALNGTVVGLGIDTEKYNVVNPDSCPNAELYPQFIVGSVPFCECIGSGIVRSIDPATRQFFITVPSFVPPAQLQRVNTLLRGTIPTPIPLSLEISAGQRVVASAPYTAVDTASLKHRSHNVAAERTQAKRDKAARLSTAAKNANRNDSAAVINEESVGEVPTSPPLEEQEPNTEAMEVSPTTEEPLTASTTTSTLDGSAPDGVHNEKKKKKKKHQQTPSTPSTPTSTPSSTPSTPSTPSKPSSTPKSTPSKPSTPSITTTKTTPTTKSSSTHSKSAPSTPSPTSKLSPSPVPSPKTPKSSSPVPSPLEKKRKHQTQTPPSQQKKQKHQEKEHKKAIEIVEDAEEDGEQESGKYVRNPRLIEQNGEPEAVEVDSEQQEKLWAELANYDDDDDHLVVDHSEPVRKAKKLQSPRTLKKNAKIRANVSARQAKRIAPAGDTEIVGAKKGKHIPRR